MKVTVQVPDRNRTLPKHNDTPQFYIVEEETQRIGVSDYWSNHLKEDEIKKAKDDIMKWISPIMKWGIPLEFKEFGNEYTIHIQVPDGEFFTFDEEKRAIVVSEEWSNFLSEEEIGEQQKYLSTMIDTVYQAYPRFAFKFSK